MKTIPHWINGQAKQSGSNRQGDVYDPALGSVASKVGFADQADIDLAVAAAKAAFPAWRDLALGKRQSIIFKFRELLEAKKSELAAIITQELSLIHI